MTNQGTVITLIILSGVLYGFSKRNPNSLLVKLARKYGWVVIAVCFADIISIQMQHQPLFDTISKIMDVFMLLTVYLLFRASRKTKIK